MVGKTVPAAGTQACLPDTAWNMIFFFSSWNGAPGGMARIQKTCLWTWHCKVHCVPCSHFRTSPQVGPSLSMSLSERLFKVNPAAGLGLVTSAKRSGKVSLGHWTQALLQKPCRFFLSWASTRVWGQLLLRVWCSSIREDSYKSIWTLLLIPSCGKWCWAMRTLENNREDPNKSA